MLYRCIYKVVGFDHERHLHLNAEDVPQAIQTLNMQMQREGHTLTAIIAVVPERLCNLKHF
jgi:hypothetical protein